MNYLVLPIVYHSYHDDTNEQIVEVSTEFIAQEDVRIVQPIPNSFYVKWPNSTARTKLYLSSVSDWRYCQLSLQQFINLKVVQ